jgi:hypothetical protein
MHKVYLLLRNNKQLGPYSLDELLQQSLKPFDLVWVEGRSAGWRYPTEIDTLKPYVAAEPEALTEPVLHSAAINAPVAVITEPAVKNQVYVRLPSTPDNMAPVGEKKEEEESMAEKLEKKAAALYQRAQAYASGEKKPSVDAPETEIKYSRSLEDIKEEYSSWLYTQRTGRKKNLRVNKRVLLLSAGFLGICLAGYYFFSGTPSHPDPAQPVTEAMNTPPDLTQTPTPQTLAKVKKKSRSGPVTAAKKKKLNSGPVTAAVKKQAAARQRPVSGTTKTDAPMNLADLVQVQANYAPDDEKGVPEFRITVKNNSDVFLRFVAVDVYYHRDKGAPEKKTIYFRNISPHQSLSLMAPANKKADDVHLQMGLLSSSNGDLYYATN